MKAVIQRVRQASVVANGTPSGNINHGILVLLGVHVDDDINDLEWLVRKITQLRIFNDDAGIMNQSVIDVEGECLVVSQFTLYASTKKGNRPSYIAAAKGEKAEYWYQEFVQSIQDVLKKPVNTGIFGADMQVELINDGPVTIIIDSKQKD